MQGLTKLNNQLLIKTCVEIYFVIKFISTKKIFNLENKTWKSNGNNVCLKFETYLLNKSIRLFQFIIPSGFLFLLDVTYFFQIALKN